MTRRGPGNIQARAKLSSLILETADLECVKQLAAAADDSLAVLEGDLEYARGKDRKSVLTAIQQLQELARQFSARGFPLQRTSV